MCRALVLTFNPLWWQFSLMATFPENVLGILLFCGCVMVIGVIQVRRQLRSGCVSAPLLWLALIQRVPAPGRHRGVRLQPSFPAERADPDLGEPDLLQTPHPQSHHAGSAHVLHCQRLLLHLLPASRRPLRRSFTPKNVLLFSVLTSYQLTLSALLIFSRSVLRAVGHRYLPAVHLPVSEVVSRQDDG